MTGAAAAGVAVGAAAGVRIDVPRSLAGASCRGESGADAVAPPDVGTSVTEAGIGGSVMMSGVVTGRTATDVDTATGATPATGVGGGMIDCAAVRIGWTKGAAMA